MGRRGWAITIVFSLVVIMIIVMIARSDELLLGGSGSHEWKEITITGSGSDKVVQLFVDGVIAEKSSFSSSFSSMTFMSQLEQVKKDDSVKAVVIRVNTPGGGVVASDDIQQKIVEIQEAGKQVIVSMGTIAASGGYYIAAPADRIFANTGTITGSIGVIFTLPNYEGVAEWLGYKEIIIKSGEMKDIGNSLREMRSDEREIFQAMVDESYEQFVDVIAEGRGLTRERVYELADGRLYTGKQAQELGLVDEIGSLEAATHYVSRLNDGSELRVVRYDRPFSLSQALLDFQGKTNPSIKEIIGEAFPGMHEESGLMYLYKP